MKEIFDALEYTQSHGGMMIVLTYLIFETRYLRRDVDNLLNRRKVAR